jgi:hypothetical protein
MENFFSRRGRAGSRGSRSQYLVRKVGALGDTTPALWAQQPECQVGGCLVRLELVAEDVAEVADELPPVVNVAVVPQDYELVLDRPPHGERPNDPDEESGPDEGDYDGRGQGDPEAEPGRRGPDVVSELSHEAEHQQDAANLGVGRLPCAGDDEVRVRVSAEWGLRFLPDVLRACEGEGRRKGKGTATSRTSPPALIGETMAPEYGARRRANTMASDAYSLIGSRAELALPALRAEDMELADAV